MQNYNEQDIRLNIENQQKEKIEALKNRVSKFSEIETLEEAKLIAENNFRLNNEFTEFSISNVRCVIVNKDDLLRVTLDTPEEFVSYDFA